MTDPVIAAVETDIHAEIASVAGASAALKTAVAKAVSTRVTATGGAVKSALAFLLRERVTILMVALVALAVADHAASIRSLL